jgi:hypothetical protein
VVCRGQQDLIQMFKTKAFKKFLEENGHINIYALSSEFGLRINNTHYKPPVTNMKKYKLLKDMKAMAVDEECIIFHVDMIGEGIDVPGITGVMPFRNCEISKFVQNIGRAARLHPEDRKRFYDKEINPYMVDKYIKPCSWIIIPEFLSNSEGFSDRFKGIIRKLRSEYGITKEQVLITNDRGLADDEEIDTDNELEKVKRHSKSGINDFDHEFEEMTPIEKVIKFEEVMGRENAVADELRKVAEIGGMINENS